MTIFFFFIFSRKNKKLKGGKRRKPETEPVDTNFFLKFSDSEGYYKNG